MPGILTHFVNAILSAPAQQFLRLGRISVAGCDIPRPARHDLERNFFAARFGEGVLDLQHGIAVAGSQVDCFHTLVFQYIFHSFDVAQRQIDDMDVIADAGSVDRIVIIAPDPQEFTLAGRNLGDIRH